MPGAFEHLEGGFFEHLQGTLPGGPVQHTRLAEPAAPDAASLDLQDDAILGRLDKGHQRLLRIIRMGEVCHHLLFYLAGRVGIHRLHGRDGPVLMIRYLIKGGHIDAGNACGALQELLAAPARFPYLLISVNQGKIGGLPFPDIKEIEKLRQRLRIHRAGTAADDDGILPGALCGA